MFINFESELVINIYVISWNEFTTPNFSII